MGSKRHTEGIIRPTAGLSAKTRLSEKRAVPKMGVLVGSQARPVGLPYSPTIRVGSDLFSSAQFWKLNMKPGSAVYLKCSAKCSDFFFVYFFKSCQIHITWHLNLPLQSFLRIQFSGNNYQYTDFVWHPSHHPTLELYSSCKTETLSPLNTNYWFPPSHSPSQPHSYFLSLCIWVLFCCSYCFVTKLCLTLLLPNGL